MSRSNCSPGCSTTTVRSSPKPKSPDRTTENLAFGPLLDQIGDLDGKVITADAAHTNAANARDVVEEHNGHYLLALKGNQPTIETTVKALPGGSFSP